VLGGAPVSLLNLLQGIQAHMKLDITVFCAHEAMGVFFRRTAGVRTAWLPDPLTILGRVLIWGIAPLEGAKMAAFIRESLHFPLSVWRQYRIFRKVQPDIVHLNSAVLLTSALAARLARIPVVWHVRETLAGRRWSVRRALVGAVIRRVATRVVAISQSEASALGADRHHKVSVVYNAIDFTAFDPARWKQEQARVLLGIPLQARLILSLGGVSHWKGTAELIEAMACTSPGTLLLLAGPPLSLPDASVSLRVRCLLAIEDALVKWQVQPFRLIRYADRVRMALRKAPRDRIRFLGIREDVPCLLAAADIVAFAGMAPHFPRPVFEAWAMKKPVVVFRVRGIASHVTDGVDGVVVRDLSGRALGQALACLLADPQRLQVMGATGYAKARNCFDREVNAQRMVRVYEETRRQPR
jgi:glycosyltransferase involved in cell wall biosynthesis